MHTRLSFPVCKVLHWDIEMLEVSREDPSDAEGNAGHGGPRPDKPWVSDNTCQSEHDGGGNGLVEESEGVDETLHSGRRSSVGKFVGGDIDE